MRHKYVTQFCTTYTYNLVLEGDIFIYNNQIVTLFQDHQEWVFQIYCLVTTGHRPTTKGSRENIEHNVHV